MSETLAVDLNHPDESVLQRAANVVQGGGLIVYPTETLYGIGADAMNPLAVRKVQHAKQRQENKPILVIVNSVEMMRPLVDDVSASAKLLMEKFWPGPLTLVFKSSSRMPDALTLGSGSLGVRIPSSEFCLHLLTRIGGPLTSTSANPSGRAPARTVRGIREDLKGIDLYLDAGELPESLPSTVVDVSNGTARLLRNGAVTFEQLRHILPDIQLSIPTPQRS